MQNKKIIRYCYLTFVTIFILTNAGCVSHQWALNHKMTTLDTSQESIALMMLTASNQYKPNNWLIVNQIYIKEKGNEKKFCFNVSELSPFISLKLPPSGYKIWFISGEGYRGGKFDFYCEIDFYLEPNAIIYLGHLDIVNRKRTKGEKRSGYIIPLVDQYLGGFLTGTIEITISDRYDEEIEYFNKCYPVLRNYTVGKNIMILNEGEQ